MNGEHRILKGKRYSCGDSAASCRVHEQHYAAAGRLVPVEVAAGKSPVQRESNCGLAVVLPGGRRIEVLPDFDTNTFERLVIALERA